MSTKIFNAYRFPGSTNLPRFCRDLHDRLTPVYQDLAVSAIAATSLMLVDDDRPDDDPDGLSNTIAAQVAWDLSSRQLTYDGGAGNGLMACAAGIIEDLQEVLERPGARSVLGWFDLIFAAAFMADPASPEWTYAKVFCEREEYRRVWEATPGVEPFDYWNNADRPEGMSQRKWAEREAIWDRVLGDDSPAQVGVTWRYRNPTPLVAQAMDVLPPDSRWITRDAVADRIITIAKDSEVLRSRRDWLLERLAGRRLGKDPDPMPARPEDGRDD